MARYTVAEIADKLGVERETARGFVKFLVELKLVDFKGERPSESGRGKAQHVYEFADGYEKVLTARLKRAELT